LRASGRSRSISSGHSSREALSTAPGFASIVPLAPELGGTRELLGTLRDALGSERHFVAHDIKEQMRSLAAAGLPRPLHYDDTMLMSYVLNPGAYGHTLENVCRERLKRDVISRKDFSKKTKTLSLGADCLDYLGEKSDLAICLFELIAPEIMRDESLCSIYRDIELPLTPVLAAMEEHGIRVDVALLREMSRSMGAQLEDLEKKIYKEAGQEFNINSPAQLATILFDKLQYPAVKKTQKTRSFSTGVEVLKELASYGYAVPRLILEHRELHKLKSTYVDALPELLDSRQRVHTTFNQAIAATGRLSSSDPNLQNIPIRTALGREIRRAFIADPGAVLLGVDYSQVELRILAHMSRDENLIEAFRRGADIHRATAARIFNVPEAEVTADQRRASKTINFGVLYGMSAFRLSQDLGISTAEGKEFIDAYFARYPRIREYLDRTLEEARTTGRVTTLFGRVRHIPEIHNRSFTIRGNAERMATNAPIQGTAADLLKLAMIALDGTLAAEAREVRMLLTVHDEIVFEVPSADVERVEALVRRTMETIYPLAVPLAVETGWGTSWYEAKS
jgi:DNA polymerase I